MNNLQIQLLLDSIKINSLAVFTTIVILSFIYPYAMRRVMRNTLLTLSLFFLIIASITIICALTIKLTQESIEVFSTILNFNIAIFITALFYFVIAEIIKKLNPSFYTIKEKIEKYEELQEQINNNK